MSTKKFVDEAEFRAWLRKEQPQVAEWLETTVLPDYAPSAWAQQIRIEDDLADGDDDFEGSPPLALPATLNVGVIHPAEAPRRGVMKFYKTFKDGPAKLVPQTTPTEAPADAATNATPSAAAMNAHAAKMQEDAGPVAEDDEDADADFVTIEYRHERGELTPADADCCAIDAAEEAAALLEQHGGPDGVRWLDPSNEAALLSAWSSAPPPIAPLRLLVPDKAAHNYEKKLADHTAQCIAAAAPPGAEAADPRPVAPTRSRLGGRRVIALPGDLLDASSQDEDEASDESIRLSELRVREAYAEAELKAIDSVFIVAERKAYFGEGAGTAVQRMKDRKRHLKQYLRDVAAEKRSLKKPPGRRAAGAVVKDGTGRPPARPAFMAADAFEGGKPGYVFKNGEDGLGYYRDARAEMSAERRS